MSFFTSKSSNVTNTGPNASSQAILDDYNRRAAARYNQPTFGAPQQRMFNDALGFASQRGTQGINNYFDPYQGQVIAGAQAGFDRMRGQSDMAAADLATKEGAFGGSRSAILQAQGREGINRDEGNTIAGLFSGGWQQALQALQNDRSMAGQFGLAGMNAGVNEQNSMQQGQGYGLGFGGTTSDNRQTQTPSIFSMLMQLGQQGTNYMSALPGTRKP